MLTAVDAPAGRHRPPAPRRTLDRSAPGPARRRRWPPGPVRAVDVHRLLVPLGPVPPGSVDGRARGAPRRPGHAAALDHPPRVGGRLLAAEPRRPRAPGGARGAGGRAAERIRDGGRRRAGAPRPRPTPASWRARSWRPSPARVGRAASGCSSTSCGCRRRARGNAGGPTATPPPRRGSVRRPTSPRTRPSTTSCGRYLSGFGPATANEIASWAGMTVGDDHSLRSAASTLRRFRATTARVLVDLPGLPLPAEDGPDRVRFIGTWEALLLVHARRAGILREEDRPRIFGVRTPHSFNTFLVDGVVEGTWRFDDGRVDVTPWRPLPHDTQRLLRRGGRRARHVPRRPLTHRYRPVGGAADGCRSMGARHHRAAEVRPPAPGGTMGSWCSRPCAGDCRRESSGRPASTASPRPRRCPGRPTPSSPCRWPARCSSASAPTPPASRSCSTC